MLHNDVLFLVAQVKQPAGVLQRGFRVREAVKPAVTALFSPVIEEEVVQQALAAADQSR